MNIRKSILAGSWYPADPGQLASLVDGYITGSSKKPASIVVPHAGYNYSGKTAGAGYGCLRGHSWDRIVILAPNHRHWLNSPSTPINFSAYETPLGKVELDIQAMKELDVASVAEAHTQEHSIEIQLPFLQKVFDYVPPVVPILIPQLNQNQRDELVAVLSSWKNTLFIVSTDFTHYGADFGFTPFSNNLEQQIKDLDHGAIETILNKESQSLLDYGQKTGITMCGLQATALMLQLPLGDAKLLAYCRSGDQDNDYNFSVSYASISIGEK
jgi:MEMO1 family protein